MKIILVWPIRDPYAKLKPKKHKRWVVRLEEAAA